MPVTAAPISAVPTPVVAPAGTVEPTVESPAAVVPPLQNDQPPLPPIELNREIDPAAEQPREAEATAPSISSEPTVVAVPVEASPVSESSSVAATAVDTFGGESVPVDGLPVDTPPVSVQPDALADDMSPGTNRIAGDNPEVATGVESLDGSSPSSEVEIIREPDQAPPLDSSSVLSADELPLVESEPVAVGEVPPPLVQVPQPDRTTTDATLEAVKVTPAIELETTNTVPAIEVAPGSEFVREETNQTPVPVRVADELLIEFASPESLFPPAAVIRDWQPGDEDSSLESPAAVSGTTVLEPNTQDLLSSDPLAESTSEVPAPEAAASGETPAIETPAIETPAVETPAVETSIGEPATGNAPVVETPTVETPEAVELQEELTTADVPSLPATVNESATVDAPAPGTPTDDALVAEREPALATEVVPPAPVGGVSIEDLPPAPAVVEEVPVINLCVPPEDSFQESRPEIAPTGDAPTAAVPPAPAVSTSPTPSEESPATAEAETAATAPVVTPVEMPVEMPVAPPVVDSVAIESISEQPVTSASGLVDEVSPGNLPTTPATAESVDSDSPVTQELATEVQPVVQPDAPRLAAPEGTQAQPIPDPAAETQEAPASEVMPLEPAARIRSRDIPLDHMHCPFGHGMLPARQAPQFEAIDLSLQSPTETPR